MATPAKEIKNSKTDWLAYERFFQAVGGPQGYLLLKQHSPDLCQQMLEAYGITLNDHKEENE